MDEMSRQVFIYIYIQLDIGVLTTRKLVLSAELYGECCLDCSMMKVVLMGVSGWKL